MANRFILFFSAVLSFCALILAIVACAGSTKNYVPINRIYVAQVDISNISVSEVLPGVSSSSSLSLSSLGLPTFFNIGLWSYCLADANGTVESCTSPKGIQQFNLSALLFDNIDDNEVLSVIDSVADVILPSSLDKKMTYYNDLVKCMFITILIGICVTFLNLVVNIIRWIIHARLITWVGGFLSFIGFASLLISAGTSLGTYLYIRHILNQNYDDYGIKMNLGRIFFGIIWGSVAGALLNFILWCSVRVGRGGAYIAQVPIEEKPLIY